MKIEKPAEHNGQPEDENYETIGQFYEAIEFEPKPPAARFASRSQTARTSARPECATPGMSCAVAMRPQPIKGSGERFGGEGRLGHPRRFQIRARA